MATLMHITVGVNILVDMFGWRIRSTCTFIYTTTGECAALGIELIFVIMFCFVAPSHIRTILSTWNTLFVLMCGPVHRAGVLRTCVVVLETCVSRRCRMQRFGRFLGGPAAPAPPALPALPTLPAPPAPPDVAAALRSRMEQFMQKPTYLCTIMTTIMHHVRAHQPDNYDPKQHAMPSPCACAQLDHDVATQTRVFSHNRDYVGAVPMSACTHSDDDAQIFGFCRRATSMLSRAERLCTKMTMLIHSQWTCART